MKLGDKNLLVLTGTISGIVIVLLVVSLFGIYKVAFEQQRQSLIQTVKDQASLIKTSEGLNADNWQNYLHHEAESESVEIVLGQRGDRVLMVLSNRGGYEKTTLVRVPFDKPFAGPMKEALQGLSGSMVGFDYKGVKVLAAYEPIPELGLGVVAKIDIAEIQRPYLKTGIWISAIAMALVALAVVIVSRLFDPILRRLEASEIRHRTILNTVVDGIIVIDARGIVQTFNRSACTLFGYQPDEVCGQSASLLMPEPYSSDLGDFLQRALRQGEHGDEAIVLEVFGKRKDGSVFPMSLAAGQMKIDGQPMLTGIVRDITESKQSEAEILAAKEDAEAANQAKSEFMSRMNHELRTPLNAVLGFGQLLEFDNSNLNQQQKEAISHILTGGSHLLQLVEELMDITRVDSGKVELSMQNVPVQRVVSEALLLIKSLAEQHKILIDAPSVCDIQLRADELRLKQVLVNLLSNAVKYNREGGSVTVRIDNLEPGWVSITVQDNGIGIKTKDQEGLFEPFNRVGGSASTVEGTGLGLTISKRLVELMGGKISFTSEFGKGTTFQVVLPTATADQPEHSL